MLVAAPASGRSTLGESLHQYRLRRLRYMPDPPSQALQPRQAREIAAIPGSGTLVPRTRSSHHNCRKLDCELRVQSGTRIIELQVSYDSEVRFAACGKLGRTSESGHLRFVAAQAQQTALLGL